jgi:hypothetical protein
MMGYRVGSNDSLSENYKPCFTDLTIDISPYIKEEEVAKKKDEEEQ